MKMRAQLKELSDLGVLYVRFPMKSNFEFQKRLIEMMEFDIIGQRLLEN